MAKKKKQTFALKAGKALAWLFVNFFKFLWFVLVGIYTGIKKAFTSTNKAIKTRKAKKLIKESQPKHESKYTALGVADVVKGTLASFEDRLLNESLIVAIAGRRGSGKSSLGFRFLENAHSNAGRGAYALGVKQSVIPAWIKSVDNLNQVQSGGVVLIDEGAISFSSRSSMSKENKDLAGLLAVARHKDLTLLFITQNTGMIDKNVLNLCDTIVLKEGSLLQERMERSVMKDFYKTANKALKTIPHTKRKSHCYVFDADFEGLVEVKLPSFWSSKVSKNQA